MRDERQQQEHGGEERRDAEQQQQHPLADVDLEVAPVDRFRRSRAITSPNGVKCQKNGPSSVIGRDVVGVRVVQRVELGARQRGDRARPDSPRTGWPGAYRSVEPATGAELQRANRSTSAGRERRRASRGSWRAMRRPRRGDVRDEDVARPGRRCPSSPSASRAVRDVAGRAVRLVVVVELAELRGEDPVRAEVLEALLDRLARVQVALGEHERAGAWRRWPPRSCRAPGTRPGRTSSSLRARNDRPSPLT